MKQKRPSCLTDIVQGRTNPPATKKDIKAVYSLETIQLVPGEKWD